MQENYMTSSYVIEMETDFTKQIKMALTRAVICCSIIHCSFLLPLEARCVRLDYKI